MHNSNTKLVNIFLNIAKLLKIQRANPHRIRAYNRGADTIAALDENIADIANRQDLRSLPGIGKELTSKIEEFLTTGTIQAYEELKTPLPLEVRSWLSLPGLSEPIVNDLYFRLGIQSLKDLKALAQSHLLRTQPGISVSTEELVYAIEELQKKQSNNSIETT